MWLDVRGFVTLSYLVSCLVACASQPEGRGTPATGVDGGVVDPGDDQTMPPTPPPATERCGRSTCGDTELCGTGDGDGNDDDCDGTVDEDCPCTSTGLTRSCFSGLPDQRGVGACADGVMHCDEFLQWGPCIDSRMPSSEVCDGADNDCDGSADEGLEGCATTLACPEREYAAPLNTHALQGRAIYAGAAQAFRWTILCPDTVPTCPLPDDSGAADTNVFFVQSGTYTARLEVETNEGGRLSCEWPILVRGAGLRVELLWDTQGEGHGNTDLDLHLHQKSAGNAAEESEWNTQDDCYYGNCKGSNYSSSLEEAWGLTPTSELGACSAAPHGEGEDWMARGSCANPRLDVDIINCDPTDTDPTSPQFCAPENINVDNPRVGQPYRIMVHQYSTHGYEGATRPTVNVYCGGELRATLGLDPQIVFQSSSGGDYWLVADVAFRENGCMGPIDCDVQPLGQRNRDRSFGPPWSF